MISRKDFSTPKMTAIVELNGLEAYKAKGEENTLYPRFLPVPSTVVSHDTLVIKEWYKEILIFPECIVIVGENIEAKGYGKAKKPILGYGIGIGLHHNSLVKACVDGTPRDIQANKWFQYYTGGTRVQSEDFCPVEVISDIRKVNIDLSIDGIANKYYDYSEILFDGEYLLKSMSKIAPFEKHDIICLGPVGAPIEIPEDHRFKNGDSIKVSSNVFKDFIIDIEDRRV